MNYEAETEIKLPHRPWLPDQHGVRIEVRCGRCMIKVRYGLDPERHVFRRHTDDDEWLVIRRVYERDLDESLKPVSDGGVGRVKWLGHRRRDRRLLEHDLKSMCEGFWRPGGDSYIEVLPWRKDGQYEPPRPVREVLGHD